MKTTDNIKIYLHTRRIASLVGVAKRKSSVHTTKEGENKYRSLKCRYDDSLVWEKLKQANNRQVNYASSVGGAGKLSQCSGTSFQLQPTRDETFPSSTPFVHARNFINRRKTKNIPN
jgi:hypothetical protein